MRHLQDRPAGRKRAEHGFTLIEFMVAIGLLSVLMIGVTSSFTSQQRTYVVVDQVAEAKQNVRVVADLIERELRNSGYMIPAGGAVCGVDDDQGPDRIYISDAEAILAMDSLPTTLLTTPLGAVITNATSAGLAAGSRTLMLENDDLDGVGGGDFQVGAGVIVVDRNAGITGVACGRVTDLPAAALGAVPVVVNLEDATGPLAAGSELVAVPAVVYELVGDELRRNGITIVDQVDDFQVAWFFDANGNSLVDAGEYIADDPGDNGYDAAGLDASQLREVRINVVLRTRDEDPNESWQGGVGQALENRDPNTVPGVDGARRRIHTSTVRLRNNA